MKNMMKEYLGYDYSNDHLKNFCLYLGGDFRADTLMSVWTPVKWVADCLNRDFGISFYKTSRIRAETKISCCHGGRDLMKYRLKILIRWILIFPTD